MQPKWVRKREKRGDNHFSALSCLLIQGWQQKSVASQTRWLVIIGKYACLCVKVNRTKHTHEFKEKVINLRSMLAHTQNGKCVCVRFGMCWPVCVCVCVWFQCPQSIGSYFISHGHLSNKKIWASRVYDTEHVGECVRGKSKGIWLPKIFNPVRPIKPTVDGAEEDFDGNRSFLLLWIVYEWKSKRQNERRKIRRRGGQCALLSSGCPMPNTSRTTKPWVWTLEIEKSIDNWRRFRLQKHTQTNRMVESILKADWKGEIERRRWMANVN